MADPARVDENLTSKIAHLARLELSATEVSTFTSQLGEILKYVDQLGEVDTSQVEPLRSPIELETPLRDDVARPSPADAEGHPKVLASAPESFQDGFKVPPIL